MSKLVVIAYPDQERAQEVMQVLTALHGQHLIDLEDAVHVTKDGEGRVELHQTTDLAKGSAVAGGFWGAFLGLLFLHPLLGGLIGAGLGALSGKIQDYGIEDDFIRGLSASLTPGTSAIFLLVRRADPQLVLPKIQEYGGTVLTTFLPKEAEERLQAALNGAPSVRA
jgi:uncharacterized membrane protein